MITIQEILGTDSISASRLTINSNFLLIENEINDLENTFNINVVTGSMDLSLATSGQIKSKSIYSNNGIFPASGTPTISLYGTGASAGNASFSGIVSASQLALSGTGSFNQINASGPAVFDSSVETRDDLRYEGYLINGASGSFLQQNSIAINGPSNPFAPPASGGGGVVGTASSPYALTFSERVIFANCSPRFHFYVATGDGGTSNPSTIPQGFTLTIINTSNSNGQIATGVFGASPGYYSGFNTLNGDWNSEFIEIAGMPYKSSITLQWENRINKGSSTQNGSWVVISAVGITF